MLQVIPVDVLPVDHDGNHSAPPSGGEVNQSEPLPPEERIARADFKKDIETSATSV